MADPVDVLDFWLGDVGPDGWYSSDAALDALCRDRFLEVWQAAHEGGLEHWVDGTVGTLAYLIICDQLSRNMHRGKASAFETDAKALSAARTALTHGWDMNAPEPERQFFYLPFMHSEDTADQALSVQLFTDKMPLSGSDQILHARAHADIIARFGRFPFRNQVLGRENSADEARFIADGGYGAAFNVIKASHAASA